MAFAWNWNTTPLNLKPYDNRSNAASEAMRGYVPNDANIALVGSPQAIAQSDMEGYRPYMANYGTDNVQGAPVQGVGGNDIGGEGGANRSPYANYGQGMAYTERMAAEEQRRNDLASIDQQIAANNARIMQLKQELASLSNGGKFADDMDRQLAMNRARAGDLANAQTHLGRIESRRTAEENRKSAERLRAIDKMGGTPEFDDLMKLAQMRTSLEAVAKDPGLRSGLEREYNIGVERYKKKYGHEPDFTGFENSVDLFYDRSGYQGASDSDLAKDSATLKNFITSKTDTNGRWTGGDKELSRAIEAAKKQGDATLAKQLSNLWTPAQYAKYTADMDKEGKDALDGLGSFARAKAERDGSFKDNSNRKWEKKNGRWKSVDYKWNGKRNGV